MMMVRDGSASCGCDFEGGGEGKSLLPRSERERVGGEMVVVEKMDGGLVLKLACCWAAGFLGCNFQVRDWIGMDVFFAK